MFDLSMLIELKEQYPDSIAIAHPECPIEVQEQADMVGSTGMMAQTVAESDAKVFVIATELGMIQQLQKRHPEKTIIPMYEGAVCRQMKKHTLEKILDEQGKEGWELVHISPHSTGFLCIWKRIVE